MFVWGFTAKNGNDLLCYISLCCSQRSRVYCSVPCCCCRRCLGRKLPTLLLRYLQAAHMTMASALLFSAFGRLWDPAIADFKCRTYSSDQSRRVDYARYRHHVSFSRSFAGSMFQGTLAVNVLARICQVCCTVLSKHILRRL